MAKKTGKGAAGAPRTPEALLERVQLLRHVAEELAERLRRAEQQLATHAVQAGLTVVAAAPNLTSRARAVARGASKKAAGAASRTRAASAAAKRGTGVAGRPAGTPRVSPTRVTPAAARAAGGRPRRTTPGA